MGWRAARDEVVWVGQLLAVVAGYAASAELGQALAPGQPHAAFAWPPVGLGLAALLLGGTRLWLGIALGAFAASTWMLRTPPLAACAFAATHTLAVLAGAVALRRIPGFRPSLDRLRDTLALVLAGTASSVLDALGGAASLSLGVVLPAGFARTWGEWWASDLLGVLVCAPVLLAWAERPRAAPRAARLVEIAALGAAMLVLAGFVLVAPQGAGSVHLLLWPYLLLLPLMWAALRFSARGAVTAMFVVAIVATGGTVAGRVALTGPDDLYALHVFLASTCLTALVLGPIVSERERSREALAGSEALVRAIVESTTDAVFVKDRLGRYLMANAAAARSVGLPRPEALIGAEVVEAFSPEEARRVRDMDEEVMRTGQPRTYDLLVTSGGTTRTFQTAKAPCHGAAGEVIGVVAISRDVTEQRAAELASGRLAAIVESSADAVVGAALDGTISSWNAAAERLFGYPPGEAIGRPLTALFVAEAREDLARLLEHARRGERLVGHEAIGCRRDRTQLSIALTLSPVRGAAGAVVGTSLIARDLADTAERLRLALEASRLGMWFWNLGDDRVSWTRLCRTMHAIGPDEEGRYARWFSSLHPDDRAPVQTAIDRAIRDRCEHEVEYRVVWPDGTVRWISSRGRVFYDDAGAPVRMVGVVLDVTQQKQAEEERAELLRREQVALAEARAAANAKDEFLAVLSHELRTPLQAVLGWTVMLKQRPRDAAAVEKGLGIIERAAGAQAQLIEDLLDVSRIVAGKLRLERRRVDLAEVVGAALETARVAAAARSIRLDAAVERPAGSLVGDPDRLQQVVQNLLTNAVKFTRPGGRVGVRLADRGATATLAVEDDGCGLSPELLPHVFDRFRQADGSTTRRHAGLGLGLAIVRHLVEAHGGTVKAESAGEGRGSTFTVTLPLSPPAPRAIADERAPEGPRPATLGGVRVLLVDDDPDARELVSLVLAEQGAEVRAVDSVRAALDALPSFHPDVLLSDIGMPEEDGYALIAKLRARERAEGGHVAAAALTAFASPADRERALALGFEAHLPKPARPGDLAAMVASLALSPRARA